MFRCCLSVLLTAIISSTANAWPATQGSTKQRLKTPIECSFVKRPLNEVMDDLGRQAGVDIYLRTQSLHFEGVVSNEPVTLNLSQPITLRSALDVILDQLRLRHVVRSDGIIEIVSEVDLQVVEKTYDISQLTKHHRIREIGNLTEGGRRSLADGIIDLLTSTVRPETWGMRDRGVSTVENDPHLLVVRQSLFVHQDISDLLEQLHGLRRLRVMTTVGEAAVSQAELEAFVFEQKLALPIVKLTAEQADAFRRLKSLKAKQRHYTAYDEETITTPKFELQSIIASNRSGVGLRWTQLHSAESDGQHEDRLASGAMILTDVTDDAAAKASLRKYLWISPQVLRSTSDRGDVLERAPKIDDDWWSRGVPLD